MALNFFRQRDIDAMDVNNIPEGFIQYFDSLDEDRKVALLEHRRDLAVALGFVWPEETIQDEINDEVSKERLEEANPVEEALPEGTIQESSEMSVDDDELEDEFSAIRKNKYEGKNLLELIVDNMRGVEALTIKDGEKLCPLHKTPFETRRIKYTRKGSDYGMEVRVCRECNRMYIKESYLEGHHRALMERRVPHTFYPVDLTYDFLNAQKPPHEFLDEEVLYFPDAWNEDRPVCPIHEVELQEIPCIKRYKERKISFTGYFCEKCNKIMVRRASAQDIEYECGRIGIAPIEYALLRKTEPAKKPVPSQEIISDYVIENGIRSAFRYTVTKVCYRLSESDTVVVSDSIYCALDGHESKEIAALIWVNEKRDGRKAYLFRLGYCGHCQKYYMDMDDYKVLYSCGRPEVTIIHDCDETNYHITSGEVFNQERQHLRAVESDINQEIAEIKAQPDYTSPYATGGYDDGNLGHAKYVSDRKYGERLGQLSRYIPKPYSYRVDIIRDDVSETYYVGATDIYLDGKQQVISANSRLGHELVNYQTIKVHKDGEEYDIKLSRQFDIDNAQLYGYVNLRTDEDAIFKSGITDPFLIRVLTLRKRQHNLTDIFVTIQENQNKIVNTRFTNNIIVQGCAGSGKTMVLLHRLSYLTYHQRNFNFAQSALILTPNDQFTLHIQGLAEELQIGGIRRASVEQYYIDMLEEYSPELKPDIKVSSEMLVQQDYVDYIYSDRFRESFSAAYDSVIEKRNALTTTINDLLENMGQQRRKIYFADDSKVIQQFQRDLDLCKSLVKRRETELRAAEDEYQKLVDRKQYLVEHIPSIVETRRQIVNEALGRVYPKCGDFLSERQHEIENLEDSLKRQYAQRERTERSRILFGKAKRLEAIEEKIKENAEKLSSERQKQEKVATLMNVSLKSSTDDAIVMWIQQIAKFVDEVRSEARLCNNIQEEVTHFSQEWEEIDLKIEGAANKEEELKKQVYSDEIKQAIAYLDAEIDAYSVSNTFQQVFDEAVLPYKTEHGIKNIVGKYHRYGLYARLLFAMRYFGKVTGTVRFMCVDEGQDLAINEYRLLYEINHRNIVFNIFGDTNQLIKTGRGITDWAVLEEMFNADLYTLNENYRNTNQITRFCNRNFKMSVLETGVDGPRVREIHRREFEGDLAKQSVVSERIAILVPRSVQKAKYLDKNILPSAVADNIGDEMGNGQISLMYVDEVKGIEFDKAYVVSNKMSRNEKYIAYTRALSELIIVVDENVKAYDDGSVALTKKKTETGKNNRKKNNKNKVLDYKEESLVAEAANAARPDTVIAEESFVVSTVEEKKLDAEVENYDNKGGSPAPKEKLDETIEQVSV